VSDAAIRTAQPAVRTTAYAVILTISFCHMLNDVMQSLLAAIYPILKAEYGLAFWQIGLLTVAFQITASLLQPLIGLYTDKRPKPYSLAAGMASTFCGLLLIAYASSYSFLLLGASLIGIGSAIFHPEASRVVRTASGGRYGLAQSVFQVGGNFGSAMGPLLAAFVVVPGKQTSVAWFSVAALLGMVVLHRVGAWYQRHVSAPKSRAAADRIVHLPRKRVLFALGVLGLLVFAKYSYTASFTSYYSFYAMQRFGVTIQQAQLMLFVYLGAVALGTVFGGAIADRIGAKTVIWASILGILPFTLALPYANLEWTLLLTFIIGIVGASAFPVIVVFAQELVPHRVGLIAGIFFGFSFGIGGIAAAGLGVLADIRGIEFVYKACSFLPLIGLAAVFLPSLRNMQPQPTAVKLST